MMKNKGTSVSMVGFVIGVLAVIYTCTLWLRHELEDNMQDFREDTLEIVRAERDQQNVYLKEIHESIQKAITKLDGISAILARPNEANDQAIATPSLKEDPVSLQSESETKLAHSFEHGSFETQLHAELTKLSDPEQREINLNFFNEISGFVKSLTDREKKHLEHLKEIMLKNSLQALKIPESGSGNSLETIMKDPKKRAAMDTMLTIIAADKMRKGIQ